VAVASISPIDIQPRDLAVLRGLFEARVMAISHIADLFFDGKAEAAKKRLQKLKAAGFVAERSRRPYEPAVLHLTSSAFRLLRKEGVLADFPHLEWSQLEKRARVSDLTLRHELDVLTVKAALTVAVRRLPNFAITEYVSWPLLYQFEASSPDGHSVLVKPDSFLRLRENDAGGEAYEHTFFLEVDRSTETQDTLAERAALYRDYYRRGGLARRLNGEGAAPEDVPFRVLFVFKTAERRNNAAERMLQLHPPVLRQAWLTTFEEVTRDPLGAIWVQPHDYLEVTCGTAFDPERRRELLSYRRQSEREALVEQAVRKHCLLGAPQSA
jgi:hypothetical protein